MEPTVEAVVIPLALILSGSLMLLLQWGAVRRGTPNLGILARWARWVFIALIVTNLFVFFEYQGHPLWAIAVAAFLGWFLLETLYTWLAVTALSRSELPLFPRYEESRQGSGWPSEERYLRLRDWLRREHFKPAKFLLATHEGNELMRLAIFDREDRQVRASFLFFANAKGTPTLACSFQSDTTSGHRLLTDNLFIPFGGFFPETWHVERRPRWRSVQRLYQRHLARCDARGEPLAANESDPLAEINASSRELEQLNRELGFLTEHREAELAGRISSAGRVRIWMEIWTLSYLGEARRY
ncbi:MAG: hypothetical protein ACOC3I_11580 [Verrucomicrobiota bacterium]